MRGAAKVLAAMLLLLGGVPVCAQARPPLPAAPQPTIESHDATVTSRHCDVISRSDAKLEPLSRLCEFAMGYRDSLPNFVCEQKTTSRANWYGGPPPRTVESQITYRDGAEFRSNVRVNGEPAEDAPGKAMTFRTQGEFGGELMDLFAPTVKPQFRYETTARIRGVQAQEFSFHLLKEDNQSWAVSVGARMVLPEFRGSIWLEAGTAKLLRFSVEPLNLPKDFLIESGNSHTEYSDVSLGEAGTYLLPIHSEARACLRTRARSGAECINNTIDFRACRKFAGKARIVP